jgi:large conductance mechanosensitive channel
MIEEFRKFIARGNVLDLAVAVIIGAAFSAIINSVVNDLFTPLLGLLGDRNFSNLYLVLKGSVPPGTPYEAAKGMGVVFGYGAFLTAVLNFLLVALVMFVVVQAANRLQQQKKEEEQPKAPELTKEEQLLTEIRDLLKR